MNSIKKILLLLMTALFFACSSHSIIHIHHCCHCKAHHHAPNDHSHCKNTTLILEFKDDYDITTPTTKPTFHFHCIENLILFIEQEISNKYEILIDFVSHTPPLCVAQNISLNILYQQFVFYCIP
ncbi:MAG: hypothetical protein MJZ76_00025 [Bacteroidales bacterium]|nr:hypothetical protein [Bacteroidales bacterium]